MRLRGPSGVAVAGPKRKLLRADGKHGYRHCPPVARAGTVDVLVGLLAELDEATESGVFYDRVCRAVCTLTTMKRAALLLHDDAYRAVIPVGSHGLDPELLKVIEGTLDETPIARRAFEEDRVVEVTGGARRPGAAALRRAGRDRDADLHADLRRPALARGDLRRPRRRGRSSSTRASGRRWRRWDGWRR